MTERIRSLQAAALHTGERRYREMADRARAFPVDRRPILQYFITY